MSKQSKTAGKTAARNKSRIERNIINALERAKEIVIRREETPAGIERKRMDMLSTFDRLHELSQLYRGGTSFTKNDITFTDGDDRVTIEITGKAFAKLKEITEITNKWGESDYTLSDMLRTFCLPDSFLYLHDKYPKSAIPYDVVQVLPGAIVAQYGDCDELASIFASAGFSVHY